MARREEMRNEHRVSVGGSERKRSPGRARLR
jgi:hypothetical protein